MGREEKLIYEPPTATVLELTAMVVMAGSPFGMKDYDYGCLDEE